MARLLPARRSSRRAKSSLSNVTHCFADQTPSMSRDDYLSFLDTHRAQVQQKPKTKPKGKHQMRPSSAPAIRKVQSKHFGIDCSNQPGASITKESHLNTRAKSGSILTRRRSVADAGTWCCPASKVPVRQLQRKRQRQRLLSTRKQVI